MSDSSGNRPFGQPEPYGGQQPPAYPPPTGQPAPPYGQQPTASPYGQQSEAQPQPESETEPGQEPRRQTFTEQYGAHYGQPGYGQPGYGQPGYGQPGYGRADRRPGTVTTASVLTFLFAGPAMLLFGLVGVAMLVARDMMATELASTPGLEGIRADQIVSVAGVTLGVLALWSLIAVILAVGAMKRSNGSRIGLVVSAVVTALFCGLSMIGATDPISLGMVLIVFAAAVTTVVCLFTGGAGAWYAGRSGATASGPRPSGPVA